MDILRWLRFVIVIINVRKIWRRGYVNERQFNFMVTRDDSGFVSACSTITAAEADIQSCVREPYRVRMKYWAYDRPRSTMYAYLSRQDPLIRNW